MADAFATLVIGAGGLPPVKDVVTLECFPLPMVVRMCKKQAHLFLDRLQLRRPSKQGDIFVFTVSRSGLTWLLDILDTHPNIRCLQAVFAAWQTQTMSRYFEPRMRYLDLSHEDLTKMGHYIADILSSKIYPLSYKPLSARFKLRTNLNVLAITEACNLAPWLEQTFGCRILYLVRHPISNSLSRLRNRWHQMDAYPEKGWRGLIDVFLESRQFCECHLNPDLVKRCWQIRQEGSLLERYVLSWCLDNIVPFQHLSRRPWLLVTYEDLVVNPDSALQQITAHFRVSQFEGMKTRFNLPSKSTDMSEQETIEKIRQGDKHYLVSRWRDQVSETEVDQCFDILDDFGFDLYDRDSDLADPKYVIYKQAHRPDITEPSV